MTTVDISDGSFTAKAMDRIIELEQQLASEKSARLKAEAACAAFQGVLGTDQTWPLMGAMNRLAMASRHLLHAHDCDCVGHEEIALCCQKADDYSKAYHALSTDCGKGWLSPEKSRLAREALEYAIANPDDCLGTLERIEKALAALKEDA